MLKMFNMTSHKPSHIPLENMEITSVNGAPELLYSGPFRLRGIGEPVWNAYISRNGDSQFRSKIKEYMDSHPKTNYTDIACTVLSRMAVEYMGNPTNPIHLDTVINSDPFLRSLTDQMDRERLLREMLIGCATPSR